MSRNQLKISVMNERGGMAALLSVVVLSMIMVSTLSSFYIYLENRAKFQHRLKMNYQTGFVMEDLSRAVAEAIDSVDTCLAANLMFLDCAQVCGTPTGALPGEVPTGTPALAVCARSNVLNKIVNNADYFCAYNVGGGSTIPSYCAGLASNEIVPSGDEGVMVAMHINNDSISKTKITNWYSRLDKFFDTTIVQNAPMLANQISPILEAKLQPPTLLGWMLPQKAYAYNPLGEGGSLFCRYYPNDPSCAPTTQPPTIDPIPTVEPTPTVYPTVSPTGVVTNDLPTECIVTDANPMPPEYCAGLKAQISLEQIGHSGTGSVVYNGVSNCGPESTDRRCKRCSGADRTLGVCLKISTCPAWLDSAGCRGINANGAAVGQTGTDNRVHQMIRISDALAMTSDPPLGGPIGGGVDCGGCSGPTPSGLGCTWIPISGGCRDSCSTLRKYCP